eukprot:TRINITY_DN11679_c2_g1_i1.p3 TRINITY_DN11679_c2_g1~~TRINITY_DN11679_c2_g1_i1.p3  ORF type:complete len:186 (+),score=21.28 TRINITY_DN11679_c2_g1_i1:3299-3856(+)
MSAYSVRSKIKGGFGSTTTRDAPSGQRNAVALTYYSSDPGRYDLESTSFTEVIKTKPASKKSGTFGTSTRRAAFEMPSWKRELAETQDSLEPYQASDHLSWNRASPSQKSSQFGSQRSRFNKGLFPEEQTADAPPVGAYEQKVQPKMSWKAKKACKPAFGATSPRPMLTQPKTEPGTCPGTYEAK